jgi:hypothetical protein
VLFFYPCFFNGLNPSLTNPLPFALTLIVYLSPILIFFIFRCYGFSFVFVLVEELNLDFGQILAEEVESEMKEAAVISMGTEVSDHDMLNIKSLCDQVIQLSEY